MDGECEVDVFSEVGLDLADVQALVWERSVALDCQAVVIVSGVEGRWLGRKVG